MQTLMVRNQRRLNCKALWQAADRHKLLFITVLLAWSGTISGISAGSLENRSHVNTRGNYLYTDAEPLKAISPLAQTKEAQNLKADLIAISHTTSSNSLALPRAMLADELTCLALNIYWEARNQSMAGQVAVAQVTMNRVSDPRYADNVCDVVYEHKQFSWYWDGKADTPREPRAWEKATLIASAVLNGSRHIALQGVTHYHAVYSKPFWKDHMVQIAMIEDHVFYADWQ